MEEAIVLVVKYKKSGGTITEKAVESFAKLLTAQNSTVEVVYRGSNQKVIATLKSMLELAK